MESLVRGVLAILFLFPKGWPCQGQEVSSERGEDRLPLPILTPPSRPSTIPPPPPPPPRRRDLLADIGRYLSPDPEKTAYVELPTFDGWYNNRAHSEYGAADTPLGRVLPPRYKDGVYQTAASLANPLDVSARVMAGDPGSRSRGNKTAFFVYFGQHLLREIVDVEKPACPFEYDTVEVPPGHEYRAAPGRRRWRVPRDKFDRRTGMAPLCPREQTNGVTAWIDGSAIYGSSKYWSNGLRSFQGGRLQSSRNGSYPPLNRDPELPLVNLPPPAFHKIDPSSKLWKFGARNGNESPFLSAIGVLWFRWHNYLADHLKNYYDTDQKIFEQARKWTVATYQHIVMDHWAPALLGEPLPAYKESQAGPACSNDAPGYEPQINPAISQLFQAGAGIFLDTLTPPAVFPKLSSDACGEVDFRNTKWPHGVRLCNTFWRSREVLQEFGLDAIVAALIGQPAEREDHILVEDLQSKFYGPLEFSRQSKGALHIQKGRDHGIPTYAMAFQHYFPDRNQGFETWEQVRPLWNEVDSLDPSLLNKTLPALYRSPRDVDFAIGILMEIRVSVGRPGRLLLAIVKEQLLRLRNADRFWYENEKNGLFNASQLDFVKQITIHDVIKATTCLNDHLIREDPFHLRPESQDVPTASAVGIEDLERCTPGKTFDYFEGSGISFVLLYLFLFVFILGCIAVLFHLVKKKKIKVAQEMKHLRKKKSEAISKGAIIAREWQGHNKPKQKVLIEFDEQASSIRVREALTSGNDIRPGHVIRSLDLHNLKRVELQVGTTGPYFLIRTPNEYDLVLIFVDDVERDIFISDLHTFLGLLGVGSDRKEVPVKVMVKQAVTKQDRQRDLEKFFRMVFAQAFDMEMETALETSPSPEEAHRLVHMELTRYQFAECLSLQPSSAFVNNMFALADKDGNGYINFREFLDILVIFSKGNADDKAKLMFDMYNIDRSGSLSRADFTEMIKSLLELSNQTLNSDQIDQLVSALFTSAGIDDNSKITLADFKSILADHKEELGYACLEFQNLMPTRTPPPPALRNSVIFKAQQTFTSTYGQPGSSQVRPSNKETSASSVHVRAEIKKSYEGDRSKKVSIKMFHLLENYQLQIIWLSLITMALWGVFIQRAYHYSVEREDSGLRRLAGYGVTVSRGSASSIMLAFSLLLLTMCRNLITVLRETFLHRFVPFDAAVSAHKYLAFWALFFSVLHIVGHGFNFYHFATQPVEVLHCMFPDYYHGSDGLPKFHYWAFSTITGLTGIVLVLVLTVMYVFAVQYARRHVFNAFWQTHSLYPLVYGLTVLHGLGNLLQAPSFHLFLLGPGLLFIADRLISISRKRVEIAVLKAHMLPSDVTNLVFKRPANFEYRSGQWVRIACKALNSHEYHPFTLSSAPHEENLSLHIRAAGPWTINLRKIYHPDSIQEHSYPKLYLDGPFGGGHQDWFRYEVSVLVGGGIGVTPFASILKDIAFRASLPQPMALHSCKKVYFLWVTRTQRQFEWLIDIIRNVEEKDCQALVETHIFITQFYQKFDLRTIMLYICERHFQKLSNRSLFTGLSAITHFGRPNFSTFFDSLQKEYSEVKKIGVFSCGPPPMTLSVDDACKATNKQGGALFVHHYENF